MSDAAGEKLLSSEVRPKAKAKAKSLPYYGATSVLDPPQQAYMECLDDLLSMSLKEDSKAVGLLIKDAGVGNKFELNGRSKKGVSQFGLFQLVETSGCIARCMKKCYSGCAPWSVDVYYSGEGGPVKAMQWQRNFTLNCCCFNRPSVDIIDVKLKKKLGSMTDPCNPCDMTFTAFDQDDRPALYAKGGCCQPGLACPFPCGPCAVVNVSVDDAKTGKEVARIKREIGCNWCLGGEGDTYQFDVEKVRNYESKALLLALSLFIDFRYFTAKGGDCSPIGCLACGCLVCGCCSPKPDGGVELACPDICCSKSTECSCKEWCCWCCCSWCPEVD
eukprot:gb/GFBE01073171.1/.p1 GENE.gb/GFBE01073171.1/~~gb/GFBE01073171.1/.p1  ORF type:complete len:331 (+),score=64.26 gb/GFBE01073171.1/:1-993(+)